MFQPILPRLQLNNQRSMGSNLGHKQHLLCDHAERDMAVFGSLGRSSEEGEESVHQKLKCVMLRMLYTKNFQARIKAAARIMALKCVSALMQRAAAKEARIAAVAAEATSEGSDSD